MVDFLAKKLKPFNFIFFLSHLLSTLPLSICYYYYLLLPIAYYYYELWISITHNIQRRQPTITITNYYYYYFYYACTYVHVHVGM